MITYTRIATVTINLVVAVAIVLLNQYIAVSTGCQILHFVLSGTNNNLLALLKICLDYETIGGLFKDVYTGVYEQTAVEKMWLIIVEVVGIVAELTGADEDTLKRQLIKNDKRLD